jgi:hypothetical protein
MEFHTFSELFANIPVSWKIIKKWQNIIKNNQKIINNNQK